MGFVVITLAKINVWQSGTFPFLTAVVNKLS